MITVTIEETSMEGAQWVSTHNTNDESIALERAISKHWGKSKYFHENRGLSDCGMFGQIVKYVKSLNASTALTGQVAISFSHESK